MNQLTIIAGFGTTSCNYALELVFAFALGIVCFGAGFLIGGIVHSFRSSTDGLIKRVLTLIVRLIGAGILAMIFLMIVGVFTHGLFGCVSSQQGGLVDLLSYIAIFMSLPGGIAYGLSTHSKRQQY